MRRIVAGTAAASLLLLAGCTTDDGGTVTPSRSAPPTTATAPATIDRVVTELETLGYDCTAEEQMTSCTDGTDIWQIRASRAGDGDRAVVRAACEAGATEDGRVITNRDVVIYAGNDDQDFEAMSRQLRDAGLAQMDVVDHC